MPKSRPFLKIDPGSEVIVTVDVPTPRERKNKWDRMEYLYDVLQNGREMTLSASEVLHKKIQEQIAPLAPGMKFSVSREGSGTDTQWDVATQKGGGEHYDEVREKHEERHGSTDLPPNVAMNRRATRNYATLRDQYLGVLYDVHTTLAGEMGEKFADQHAQAVAATIYINANREGVPLPYRERPSDSNGDERVPRKDSPDDRLHKARIWLHEMMGRAGAHPTEHDRVLQYLAKWDPEGNPPTFETLTLDEFRGIAEVTDNGKDIAVVKAAVANMKEEAGDEEPTETPF